MPRSNSDVRQYMQYRADRGPTIGGTVAAVLGLITLGLLVVGLAIV